MTKQRANQILAAVAHAFADAPRREGASTLAATLAVLALDPDAVVRDAAVRKAAASGPPSVSRAIVRHPAVRQAAEPASGDREGAIVRDRDGRAPDGDSGVRATDDAGDEPGTIAN